MRRQPGLFTPAWRFQIPIVLILLVLPPVAKADSEDARRYAGGFLTAAPAVAGVGAMATGIGIRSKEVWLVGVATTALGPTVGHLVAGRYVPSLVLLGIKTTGVALMGSEARGDEFLNPNRPRDPMFWIGTAFLVGAAGAEAYLGVDDLVGSPGWMISPWIGAGAGGMTIDYRY